MKDLEILKFCDFLDQQKEYKLSDAIFRNLNKTAMIKTYKTDNISLIHMLDLITKYSQQNPKSFIKIAIASNLDFVKIFDFLRKIGFGPVDFYRELSVDEIEKAYKTYKTLIGSDPGHSVMEVLKNTAKSNGGKLIIDSDILSKLRQMEYGVKATEAIGETGVATKAATISPGLLQKFFSKLAEMFPKYASNLTKISQLAIKSANFMIAISAIVGLVRWISNIAQNGWEAIDSVAEKTNAASFLSQLGSLVSLYLGAASALPTEGASVVPLTALGYALFAISILLSLASEGIGAFEKDDPTDNLPNAKKTTEERSTSKPSGSAKKPSSKPSTMDKKTEKAFKSLSYHQ